MSAVNPKHFRTGNALNPLLQLSYHHVLIAIYCFCPIDEYNYLHYILCIVFLHESEH